MTMAAQGIAPPAAADGGPLGVGVERVHMVGIGGAGMEALARLLLSIGYRVSGSDAVDSRAVADLRCAQVPVFVGHAEANVTGADLVVYSAAIPDDNCERQAAARAGTVQWTRARALGALSRLWDTVAVAGTHGKTTTSTLIAEAARQAGRTPRVAIGGWVGGQTQTAGDGRLLVAEADEYRCSFHELQAWVAVITNIEEEHVDTFADGATLVAAFATFLNRRRDDGVVIINGDDPTSVAAAAQAGVDEVITFGFGAGCRVRGEDVRCRATGTTFVVSVDDVGHEVRLRMPGRHNVYNALAAVAACCQIPLPWGSVEAALAEFRGVDRRFELKAEIDAVTIVDDYAHHPTEVAAAVATAHLSGREVVVVFQPHTYSRTGHFRDAFAAALESARRVCVTSVYAARETPAAGSEADVIVDDLLARGHGAARYEIDVDVALASTLAECAGGELMLVMGAGDIGDRLDAMLAGRS
jgi:UDP-N-acetylmuramate--alanine ligase